MADSFGREDEHYKLSMSFGELRLFPAIRAEDEATVVAATGVSCRGRSVTAEDGKRCTRLRSPGEPCSQTSKSMACGDDVGVTK